MFLNELNQIPQSLENYFFDKKQHQSESGKVKTLANRLYSDPRKTEVNTSGYGVKWDNYLPTLRIYIPDISQGFIKSIHSYRVRFRGGFLFGADNINMQISITERRGSSIETYKIESELCLFKGRAKISVRESLLGKSTKIEFTGKSHAEQMSNLGLTREIISTMLILTDKSDELRNRRLRLIDSI